MKKYLALLMAAAMLCVAAAGCSGSKGGSASGSGDKGPDGREIAAEQVYRGIYSSEVTTMNYLSTGTTYNLIVGANCIDPLVENDSYGNVVACGATKWSTSEDGLTWTFNIREGQKWYDYQGNEMGEVTAEDYVAALRYVCDANNDCDNFYLVDGWIANATEYYNYTYAKANAVAKGTEVTTGDEPDEYCVDEAGKIYEIVIDDDTAAVTYEEVAPVAVEDIGVVAKDKYTLEYKMVIPRPYFLTVMAFGCYWPAPAEKLAEWGKDFGTDNTKMYYNGAYILSTFKSQELRVYTKNTNNWDAEHIYLTSINQTYNADANTVSANLFLSDEIDGCGIDADLLTAWKEDSKTKDLVSPTRVTSDYSYFYCFNFEPMFDEQYEPDNWRIAVNNENFRQAIFHGLNREQLYSVSYPDNYKDLVQNTVSPSDSYINKGKDYVTYGDLAEITSTNSYNTDKAKEYMNKAVEELKAAGAKFPVTILVQYSGDADWGKECALLEQGLEGLFGTDIVNVEIGNYGSQGFLGGTRRVGNYALQKCNWGADYADPETWTDPFTTNNTYNFAYDTTKKFEKSTKSAETIAIDAEYNKLVEEAKGEYFDMDARFEKFAKAEAYYINHAMIVPYGITGGSYQATKLNGFEGQYAGYGQATSRYKGQHLYTTAMSEEMFYQQLEAWQAKVAEAK